jgi:hypothetical protein
MELLPLLAIGDVGVLVLYLSLLRRAHWLGASTLANGIIGALLVVSLAAPLVAGLNGAPPYVTFSAAFCPFAISAIGLRSIVSRTGGLRPEVQVFYAYRRISRIGIDSPGDEKDPLDNERISTDLQALGRLRTPETAMFIDLFTRMNEAWVQSEPVDPEELKRWKDELSELARHLWGPGWQRRRW